MEQEIDFNDLTGVEFLEITDIIVGEFIDPETPKGKRGEPCQVHLMLRLEGLPWPFVMRFKTRRGVDELIVSLMTHSKNTWPDVDGSFVRNESKKIDKGKP